MIKSFKNNFIFLDLLGLVINGSDDCEKGKLILSCPCIEPCEEKYVKLE